MFILQTNYHFKLDFQKMDQHTRGKGSIQDTKDNRLQSLELPCSTMSWINVSDIKKGIWTLTSKIP